MTADRRVARGIADLREQLEHTLVRHWMTRWGKGRADDVHRREPATGHPPIPASPDVHARLRVRCLSSWARDDEPVGWRRRLHCHTP